MKTLILTLILLINGLALADEKNDLAQNTLGPEWILIGSYTGRLYRDCNQSVAEAKYLLTHDAYVEHGRQIISGSSYVTRKPFVDFLGRDNFYDAVSLTAVETLCSDITYTISMRPETRNAYARTHLQLYCKSRNYSESVTMSLYRTCIQQGEKACLTPEIKKELNAIKPLQTHDVWLTACYKN